MVQIATDPEASLELSSPSTDCMFWHLIVIQSSPGRFESSVQITASGVTPPCGATKCSFRKPLFGHCDSPKPPRPPQPKADHNQYPTSEKPADFGWLVSGLLCSADRTRRDVPRICDKSIRLRDELERDQDLLRCSGIVLAKRGPQGCRYFVGGRSQPQSLTPNQTAPAGPACFHHVHWSWETSRVEL